MKGTIELMSPRQAMIGVRIENAGFSVLELLGEYSPELGDVVSGALENLGREMVKNLTRGETWNVFIQDIHGSKESAKKLISQH